LIRPIAHVGIGHAFLAASQIVIHDGFLVTMGFLWQPPSLG
jgi:hypothetical protein